MMPVILAVHFPAKKLAKLRMSAMQLGAKVRIVEKWEYLNAVGSLTGDLDSFDSFLMARIFLANCSFSRILRMRG